MANCDLKLLELESRPKRPRPRGGRLAVVVGPMFAGKTTELTRRVRRWQRAGLTVVCLKPCCDTRYQKRKKPPRIGLEGAMRSAGTIVSHDRIDQMTLEALEITSPLSVRLRVDADCVAVDEAQFFKAHDLIQAVEAWLRADLRVVVAGTKNSRSELSSETRKC